MLAFQWVHRTNLRFRRPLSFALTAAVVVAAAGASFEALSFRADKSRHPRPGTLVDAGTFRLNLYCTGQGRPTVVLEAGLADSLDTWRKVQPEMGRFARVCSYDRAGYGYSDAGPMPRTSDRITSELRAALRSAGESPPFLLVGHSFGGFLVRVFNGKYPDEVAGLILVDATQEDQYRLLPHAWSEMGVAMRARARRQAQWAPIYIDLGIARAQLWWQGIEVSAVLLQSKYLRARASELEYIEVSAEQARAADHISDKPLVVLTAANTVDASLKAGLSETDWRAYEETWINDLQMRLARLSARGKRVLVPDSGHNVPEDCPDAIVSSVREMSAVSKQR